MVFREIAAIDNSNEKSTDVLIFQEDTSDLTTDLTMDPIDEVVRATTNLATGNVVKLLQVQNHIIQLKEDGAYSGSTTGSINYQSLGQLGPSLRPSPFMDQDGPGQAWTRIENRPPRTTEHWRA